MLVIVITVDIRHHLVAVCAIKLSEVPLANEAIVLVFIIMGLFIVLSIAHFSAVCVVISLHKLAQKASLKIERIGQMLQFSMAKKSIAKTTICSDVISVKKCSLLVILNQKLLS